MKICSCFKKSPIRFDTPLIVEEYNSILKDLFLSHIGLDTLEPLYMQLQMVLLEYLNLAATTTREECKKTILVMFRSCWVRMFCHQCGSPFRKLYVE